MAFSPARPSICLTTWVRRAEAGGAFWPGGRSGLRQAHGVALSSLALVFLVLQVFGDSDSRALKDPSVPQSWQGSWVETALTGFSLCSSSQRIAFGWLWSHGSRSVAPSSIGRFNRALYRGLAVALAFIGSLFGSFWAATSWWRSYFFDNRFPVLIAAIVLTMTSGCDSPITYGELRRRELFHAMLVAWVLGLALMWRWWGRRRPPSGDVHDPT